MNVQKVTEMYIDFRDSLGYRDSSSKTSRTKHTIRTFAKFVGESKSFEQIEHEDCSSFLYRRGTDVTNAWRKEYETLKKLFEWAFVRGHTQMDPLPKFLPNFPDSHPAYIYSKEELKRLFDASLTYMKVESPVTDPQSIRFILMITYALGLRCSETLAIRFKHIDTKQRVIHIEDSKFFKSRYVTYNAKVAKLINDILEWRKAGSHPMGPEDFVFVSKLGNQLTSLHFIAYSLEYARKPICIIQNSKDINRESMTYDIRLRQMSSQVGTRKGKTYRNCYLNCQFTLGMQAYPTHLYI